MTDDELLAELDGIARWQAEAAATRIRELIAERDETKAEVERLREVLSDLLSWFPEKPSPPEWRFKAGEYGADDAVAAARAALAKEEEP